MKTKLAKNAIKWTSDSAKSLTIPEKLKLEIYSGNIDYTLEEMVIGAEELNCKLNVELHPKKDSNAPQR